MYLWLRPTQSEILLHPRQRTGALAVWHTAGGQQHRGHGGSAIGIEGLVDA
jgi:hypothetical protein